jgi:hypothetical protein
MEIASKDVVAAAATDAIQLGAIGFDAVKQIVGSIPAKERNAT